MLIKSQKNLKEEKELLNEELKNVMAQCTELQKQIRDWTATAENNEIAMQELEEKTQRLISEKRDLELLFTRCF